jgi:membrane protein implicated in regulation of membrane protease activity
MNTVEVGKNYFHTLPHEVVNVAMALLPIVVFFLIFQVAALHLRKIPFLRIITGLLITLIGLVLFAVFTARVMIVRSRRQREKQKKRGYNERGYR